MTRLALVAAALAMLAPTGARAEDYSPAQQAAIARAAADLIERRYVDAGRAGTIANALRAAAGRWTAPIEGEAFAARMTALLREISGDGHLGLSHSRAPIPEQGGEDDFTAAEMEKWYGPQRNYGVETVERLPGNIILLRLDVFPPPAMGGDVIAAAMTVAAQGDALIIDLRHNGGGAETAALLMGYLVPGGSPLTGTYDRPSDTRSYQSSPAWVPGRRFGDAKPLYVLTSKRTFSAAEAVAYDLQALHRATIVGETTGGGAHPFAYRRISAHFALDLPEGTSINPITGGNWEGTGVKPDVAVPADDALATALDLARRAIARR